MQSVLFFFLALLFNAGSVFASPVVEWVSRPDWVEQVRIPPLLDARRDQIEDGVFYAVNDVHLRWQGDERLTYARLAMQVVTFSGLEKAATFTRRFDPSFEKISLISVNIIRGGVRISLRDRLHLEIFRRETNLEEGIVDGDLTLYANLPGVQIGDIVDIEVLYHTRAPIGALNHQYFRSLDWSDPEGITRVTVDWQKSRPFFSRVTAHGLSKTTRDLGDRMRYRWQRRDGDPIFAEKDMPDKQTAWGVLSLSEHADWGGIVETFLPYYAKSYPVPKSFRADIERIRNSDESLKTKALRVLFLVQDRVRYVGLEVGIGGYVARNPADVADNQYGDCKDKAVLLKTLLAALEIRSEVVLTHSTSGARLVQALPSIYAFNHMIVKVNLPNEVLWVDPTRSFRGGAMSGYAPPAYHWGLPIAKGVTKLQKIPQLATAAHIREVQETFVFGKNGLRLTVKTKAEGLEANWYRWKTATENQRSYARQLESYYRGLYPGMKQTRELVFNDDRDRNIVEIKESYLLAEADLFQADLISAFGFKPDGFAAIFSPPNATVRKYALKVKHPYRYLHVVSIKNPPIKLEPPADFTLETPVFSFAFRGRQQGDGITLSWTLETRRADVPPEDFAQWTRDVAMLKDNVYWEWNMMPPIQDDKPAGLLGMLQKAYERANKKKLKAESQ